jgi:hypothetical protein
VVNEIRRAKLNAYRVNFRLSFNHSTRFKRPRSIRLIQNRGALSWHRCCVSLEDCRRTN